MSKPMDIDNFFNMQEESVDSTTTLHYDLRSDAQSKFTGIDNYEEESYGFVDAMHAIMKENLEEHKRIIKAREKIGTIVNKTFDGKHYKGEVVDYDAKRNCFKVVYENGKYENVDRDEIDRIVVFDVPTEACPNHIVPRVKEGKMEVLMGIERGGTSVENHFPRKIEVEEVEEEEKEAKTVKAKTRGKKRGRTAKKTHIDYAPLYKESRRDAYYYNYYY